MASKTITDTLQSLSLLGKDNTPPASIHQGLKVAPLQLSGALADARYNSNILTPAIGVQFEKELQLKEILELKDVDKRRALLRDIAITISRNGVAFFKAQDALVPADLAALGLELGELVGKPADSTLHIHPTQELGENALPVGQITSLATKDGRQISFKDTTRSQIASSNWHTDVAFEPRPSLYTLLRMHTLPPTGGDTLWLSGYSVYDSLSPAFATLLEGLTATHDAQRFRTQARENGYKLRTDPRGSPYNAGDAFHATHPVIRTNPTTGWKSVYVSTTFTTRINELSFDESEAVLAYLFKLQHQSHDAMVKYKWSTNDVAIWDNRGATHLATFDYTDFRAGDRAVVVGETPYYDAASTGRFEAES